MISMELGNLLMYDPNNQMKIYTMTNVLYSSDDFGSTWNTLGNTTYFSGNIQNAAIAENNSNIIAVSNSNELKISRNDGGSTFSEFSQFLPNQFITDIPFDPNNDNTLVVTYGSYGNNNQKVYISHDQGQSWDNITYNLGNMPIRGVAIDHTEIQPFTWELKLRFIKKVCQMTHGNYLMKIFQIRQLWSWK